MEIREIIFNQIKKVREVLPKTELIHGELQFNNNDCQILSQSAVSFELMVSHTQQARQFELKLDVYDNDVIPVMEGERSGWDRFSYACLLQVEYELSLLDVREVLEHKKYTREGMIKRVMDERRMKAENAKYHIKWASNIYGDHILTNENGIKYKVFLRDFENETGYSDSMDSRLNKLGTTKHIMFAFKELKNNHSLYNRMNKTYPFIEIYCDPLNDYKITWHYPHTLPVNEQLLISRYFKNARFIDDSKSITFLGFLNEAVEFPIIRIRPEVQEKIETAYEEEMLAKLSKEYHPDYSLIKTELFPYQKEGVEFALFRKTAIIADEMGLGKTLQAIVTAIQKKAVFGFRKTLVVCPASLKEQWKKEIEKFTGEKALVIGGLPEEREMQYKDEDHFFYIINYETILRDRIALNNAAYDFLILDEAQRIKNYETKTASSVSKLMVKHILVITGTPIENRLIDIFSLVSAINPRFFGPLWEFSYQHCLFDPVKQNKINGYYDLQKLNKRLDTILIRREKRKVLEQLPNVQQFNVPVSLSPLQAEYHASYARGIASIISKKFMTPYDLQKLQLLLASMRMVCDSTYLIDEETNESPKLEELKYILLEKLDVANSDRKIIIFSEWLKVHKLIGQVLRENNIGFAELNGTVPVKLRGELIQRFENNPQIKIFLSTEAGGSGLNLQVADTLINFELPWNPAKKNQRIGRIDRLGQKSNKLTIFNFITKNSIEEQIASGLLIKQNLFDGVLDSSSTTNFVDFSTKGRSQFIQQLEVFIAETENQPLPELEIPIALHESAPEKTEKSIAGQGVLDLFEEPEETPVTAEVPTISRTSAPSPDKAEKTQEIEQVMNSGMQFLAGIFKMATGKDLGMNSQSIEVNQETGEVIMKFKLPD
ncbi:MAG: helicase [Bacteroidetes bacterium HGW-Bacteroidetes-11]|nr:MAG: helicase [Bacteroidetes bacterium HGW-Bacteroidetes-11]